MRQSGQVCMTNIFIMGIQYYIILAKRPIKAMWTG
jgi:hypothetical protein